MCPCVCVLWFASTVNKIQEQQFPLVVDVITTVHYTTYR